MNNYQYSSSQPTVITTEVMNAFLRSVYKWMALGLLLTAAVAYAVFYIPGVLEAILESPGIILVCAIAELGLVVYLSRSISKLSPGAATGFFLLYSALNGVTIAIILLAYTQSSVVQAFLTAAGMFAGMSLYGMKTKRDLSGIGSYLMMGIIGLLIASVVNIFLDATALEFGISLVGVVLFLGIAAYKTQFYKEMGGMTPQDDTVAVHRATILGALDLYLTFINLFIFLLRLIGSKRS